MNNRPKTLLRKELVLIAHTGEGVIFSAIWYNDVA